MGTPPPFVIRHPKYSAILSKIHSYTPTDCFFGDFAHWELEKVGFRLDNLEIISQENV